MNPFLGLLPLELDEIKEYREPSMELSEKDHVVGDMSDDLKKLWTLWKQVQYRAAELKIKLQAGEQNITHSKIHELDTKSEVIRALF